MAYRSEMLRALDGRIERQISRQITDEADERFGGMWTEQFHVEPRMSGFILSAFLCGYVTEDSAWYLNGTLRAAIDRLITYMERHRRPDGCFDLTPCNYASPPDTAFMLNAVMNGWWLLEKSGLSEAKEIEKQLYPIVEKATAGIARGGFHTPNHRWAIASCLLNWEKVTGNAELGIRARQYLNEGLDINACGEFAERSAGNYNQVNDDQMIRLFLATGDKIYLEAAAKNLTMMYAYFDPDGSVFTNNSTRQDMGKKVYADTYYILYLLTGYFLKRKDLGQMAGWIKKDCIRRGTVPPGIEWLLLYPEMDGYGEEESYIPPFTRVDTMFPESNIARIREENWSCTLLKGKANCLYFQNGSFPVYMTIYSNVCDKRNFIADTLIKKKDGYEMQGTAQSWYYLPFEKKPATSDWWEMGSAHTREKIYGTPLNTTMTVVKQKDGIDLTIKTEGLDGVPLRVEFAFLPGGYVRTEHFLQRTIPGESVNILDGTVEAMGPEGETIVIDGAFGRHDFRDRMGGAYPLSPNHYTMLFTAYTPFERTIKIRAARLDLHLVR